MLDRLAWGSTQIPKSFRTSFEMSDFPTYLAGPLVASLIQTHPLRYRVFVASLSRRDSYGIWKQSNQ